MALLTIEMIQAMQEVADEYKKSFRRKAQCDKPNCGKMATYHILDTGMNYCKDHIKKEDIERNTAVRGDKGFGYV